MKPSTKWTLAIVCLLAGNVTATVVLATVANAGKSQVIPDYYEHASHYDDAIDEAAAAAQLGWRVTAVIRDGELIVRVLDRAGTPIIGTVHVTGYPRAHADRTLDIFPVGANGTYRAPLAGSGLYDLRVVVDRGPDHFATSLRVDADELVERQ